MKQNNGLSTVYSGNQKTMEWLSSSLYCEIRDLFISKEKVLKCDIYNNYKESENLAQTVIF